VPIDPQDRATPTGVLRRLKQQTAGLISADDFIPLPCSHKDGCEITYRLKDATGKWTSIPKLIGKERLQSWIELIGNTISFEIGNVPPPVIKLLQEAVPQR